MFPPSSSEPEGVMCLLGPWSNTISHCVKKTLPCSGVNNLRPSPDATEGLAPDPKQTVRVAPANGGISRETNMRFQTERKWAPAAGGLPFAGAKLSESLAGQSEKDIL